MTDRCNVAVLGDSRVGNFAFFAYSPSFLCFFASLLLPFFSSSGKSSLLVRFTSGVFVHEYDDTMDDTFIKALDVDGRLTVVEVMEWTERYTFLAMREHIIRQMHCLVVMFSVTDRLSFENAFRYREDAVNIKDSYDFPMVLVGSKCDVPEESRVVSSEEGELLARALGMPYVEISSGDGRNINEMFCQFVRQYRAMHERSRDDERKKCVVQ